MSPRALTPNLSDDDDRRWRRVLWSLPTGLYVVGSRAGKEVNLMTANLCVQVATSPRAIAVAIEADSKSAALIDAGRGFTVSLLARRDRQMVRRFVKPLDTASVIWDEERPIAAGDVQLRSGRTGIPALGIALGVIEVRLREFVDLSSHRLAIGEVVDVLGGDDEIGEVLRMEDTKMNYGG